MNVIKILMVGDSSIGKTCLILRFTGKPFSAEHFPTIAIDFKMLQLQIEDQEVSVQIWDTAGQERFKTLTQSFYKSSDGIFLCFSVTDRKSFENINRWLDQIKNNSPEKVDILLVGNKTDLEEERVVSQEEAREFAESNEIDYIETSAKNGQNVQECLLKLCQRVYKRVKELRQSE